MYMRENSEEMLVGKQVGAKLRQLRQQHELSLECLAKQSGVSKLTLLNIERGEANPTLAVMWKIANALQVPVSTLLAIEAEVVVSRKHAAVALLSANTVLRVELLFRSWPRLELYRGYLQPQAEYAAEAHQAGVVECVTVMAGCLQMEVDGQLYELGEHDAIRFRGDRPHCYRNPGNDATVLHFAISYDNC